MGDIGAGAEGGLRPKTFRCPHCGALNPAEAEWCGQCLTRFEAPAPEPPAPEPPAPEPPAPEPPAPEAAPAERLRLDPDDPLGVEGDPPAGQPLVDPEVVGTERGAFKVTGSGVVWRCATCDSENPIDVQVCGACGAPFAHTLAPVEGPRAQGDPGTAALLSLVFAGGGHGYLGLWGQAIARGVIHVWILFSVVAGLLQADSGGGIVAGLFIIVFVGWTLLAAHDAYREALHDERAVILKGRRFLYVVMGMLLLLMLALLVAGLQARGS